MKKLLNKTKWKASDWIALIGAITVMLKSVLPLLIR